MHIHCFICIFNHEQICRWDIKDVKASFWSCFQIKSNHYIHWLNRFNFDQPFREWKWGIEKTKNIIFGSFGRNKFSKRRRTTCDWRNKPTSRTGSGRKTKVQQNDIYRHAWQIISKATLDKKPLRSQLQLIVKVSWNSIDKNGRVFGKWNHQHHQRSLHDSAKRTNDIVTVKSR